MSKPSPPQDLWNPQQYNRFRNERSQPFFDLLAAVQLPLTHPVAGRAQVADLGCGTGELTRTMFDTLGGGGRETLALFALDSSSSMLRESAAFACEGLEFHHGSIESFAAGKLPGDPWESAWDLIFSNAALQYIEDHATLFPRLCRRLAPGGQLAVQVPCNDAHPSFVLAATIAAEEPYVQALQGYVRLAPVKPPEWYAGILHEQGLAEINVYMRVYAHLLENLDQVAEWLKGTLLLNYTSRMDAVTAALFLAEYSKRLPEVLPSTMPFFFTFNRLFIYGRKPLPL